MSSPEIIELSDGDSDNDVAIVGSFSRAASASTSPVFVRTVRGAEVYTLVDSDSDSDNQDIDSILASASVRQRREASVTVGHRTTTSTSSLSYTEQGVSSTRTTKRYQSVSTSRSILSVLDDDWDNQPSAAVAEPADSSEPHNKRRKTGAVSRGGVKSQAEQDAVEAKAKEKEAAREERERRKLRDKEDRQRARDEAKAAKEAERSYQKKLKEVNRLRKTKSEALREVEIHMTHDLTLPSSPIAGALPEITRRVEDSLSKLVTVPESDTIVGGTIRVLRNVSAEWDATAKRYVPLDDTRTEWETTTILVASADEVVDRILRGNGELVEWIADVRLTLFLAPDEQLLLLVRGLEKYHSKSRSIANKAFRDSVRACLATGRAPSTRATDGLRTRVEKEEVEAELLKAQLSQNLLVVQVERTEDIEDWIFNLTGDIAGRPYKLLEKSHLPFSAPDHPRKAIEAGPTLELMLQEVNGLTASAASGISARYPSFRKLMEAYDREANLKAAEGLLMGCEIRNSKNGAAASRRVGPSLSRKVHWLFRGRDPLALQ